MEKQSEVKKNIDNYTKKAVEKYSERTYLRALIGAIPYVGGAIDILISSKASKITEKRIFNYIETLSKRLESITEDSIDKKFLETEEFFDLIINSLEKSTKTRSNNKKEYYTEILTKRITNSITSTMTAEDFLEIISELNDIEIEIARKLYDKMIDDPKWNDKRHYNWASKRGLEDLHSEKNIPKADYEFILLRLQKVGLLKEVTGTFLNYEGGDYSITDAFKNLMESLNNGLLENKC